MNSILSSPYFPLVTYICLFPISIIIYRLYLHPLAKVPGPRLAAITSLWYVNQVRKGRMMVLYKELHKKYGPAVRISPNEVSFDSKEAFQAIYSGKEYFEKGDFYWSQGNNPGRIDWLFRRHQGDELAFSGELNVQRYRNNRKNIGTTYSASSLKKYSDRVDEVVDRFVAKLKTQEGNILDLSQWIHIAIVECVGAVTLSWSPGFIDDGSDHGFLAKGVKSWRETTALGSLQQWLLVVQKWPSLRPLISKLFGFDIKAVDLPTDYVPFSPQTLDIIKKRTAAFFEASQQEEKGTDVDTEDPKADLLSELLNQTKKKPDWKLHYAGTMAHFNFAAGHETTSSITISALVSIYTRPDIQARVQAELKEFGGDLEVCKYTQACIKETLRLWPVTSTALWRKVPSGSSLTLHGYTFPAGTTVGISSPALHANPAVIGADAADFKPERWLESTEASRALERTSLAWGGGAHTCPGRHLAELMLGKLVPALLREFDVEIVEMPDPVNMDSYTYIAIMTGIQARFWPRKEGA